MNRINEFSMGGEDFSPVNSGEVIEDIMSYYYEDYYNYSRMDDMI